MSRTNRILYFIVPALSALFSCSDQSSSTPLPKAWPRLPVSISDSMTTVSTSAMEVRVNTQTNTTEIKGVPSGITVDYPNAGAHIYFTFIPVESETQRESILDNRKRRIQLNLNGAPARNIHSVDNEGVAVVAESATQIPVQLLVSLPDYVVSATAFIDRPVSPASYDSISPLITVLEHDITHSLPNVNFAADNQ